MSSVLFLLNHLNLGNSFTTNASNQQQLALDSSLNAILNDRTKIDELMANDRSNIGLRSISKASLHQGTSFSGRKSDSTRKEDVQEFCVSWLKVNFEHGHLSLEEADTARRENALERYDLTLNMVKLIAKTFAKDKPAKFRWDHLNQQEKDELALVAEHLILKSLSLDHSLPLHVATKSWVVKHMLSMTLKNEGQRKARHQVIIFYLYSFELCLTNVNTHIY